MGRYVVIRGGKVVETLDSLTALDAMEERTEKGDLHVALPKDGDEKWTTSHDGRIRSWKRAINDRARLAGDMYKETGKATAEDVIAVALANPEAYEISVRPVESAEPLEPNA